MGFLAKTLFRWNESSKNADISILSKFLAISLGLFSISRNFAKYYLHAKFQINWTIQTEITEGAESVPCHTNLQKAWVKDLFSIQLYIYIKENGCTISLADTKILTKIQVNRPNCNNAMPHRSFPRDPASY